MGATFDMRVRDDSLDDEQLCSCKVIAVCGLSSWIDHID
jgi:hypothetical protein